MADWAGLRTHADRQLGIVTRAQCRAAGLADELVQWRVESRRWVRLHPGVYLTAPGREGWPVTAYAALLVIRSPADTADAAIVGASAAFLWGLETREPRPVEIGVPHARRVTPPDGVSVRRMRRFVPTLEPLPYPWRTGVAATVIDTAADRDADGALALASTGVRKNLITTSQLAAELGFRRAHPHGALLREALTDIGSGAHSPAEVRYVRDVERAHGLPTASRQDPGGSDGSRIHDNVYEPFGAVVEVDGRLGHEGWGSRVRDGRRDRLAAGKGRFTTRVFWPDVAVSPCRTAAEVGAVLQARGWVGTPRRCRRRSCAVADVGSWGGSSGS